MKKILLFSTLLLAVLCFMGWGVFAMSPHDFKITESGGESDGDGEINSGSLGAEIPEETKHKIVESYGKLPLSFEPNRGQSDDPVKFLSRGSGYTLFLTSNEAVLSLSRSPVVKARDGTGLPPTTAFSEEARAATSAVLRMQLLDANPSPEASGLDELPGKSHYFIGNDSKKWRSNVPQYGRVRYQDVYPGVDLLFYGTSQRQLEYDFVVAPGADPKAIRLGFEGTEKLSIDNNGNLILHTPGGVVIQKAPIVYQEIEGVRQEVFGRYVFVAGDWRPGIGDTTDQEREAGGKAPDPWIVGFEVGPL